MKDNHFEFKHTRTGYASPSTVVTIKTDAECLPELLAEFEAFLRGCGFHFDGTLEIVEDFDE